MRLIDGDKLIEICDKGWRLGSAINTKIYHTVDASDIRSQPTVNAIPIEWIVKRINHYSDLILTYPNEKELLYSQTELISLLEEWEKENEQVIIDN